MIYIVYILAAWGAFCLVLGIIQARQSGREWVKVETLEDEPPSGTETLVIAKRTDGRDEYQIRGAMSIGPVGKAGEVLSNGVPDPEWKIIYWRKMPPLPFPLVMKKKEATK